MTELSTENKSKDQSTLDKVNAFLEQFDWKPEKIEEKDGEYTITLLAQLDITEIKIFIKFSTTSFWIFFSSPFLNSIERNHAEIYKKILEMNYATTLTKFGLSPSGSIFALTELPVQTMDYEEFISALRRLTNDINKYLIPIANLHRDEKT